MKGLYALLVLACVSTLSAQPSLDELYEPGLFLQDRNGDGFVDFVDAEILTGESPSSAVVAAASDIAARLGFETMAMNLPLTTQRGAGGIAVGTDAAAAIGVDVSSLAPDEGLLQIVRVEDRDWLVVAGPYDAGTRAAASVLAGRFPHLWTPGGTTFADVVDELSDALSEEAIDADAVRITRVVARPDRLTELTVHVEVSDSQLRMARELLLGRAPSYERVESILVRVGEDEIRLPRAPGLLAADLTQSGPIPERPGAGAKRSLDLSNLYTSDGLLGDADTNHIADRVDAVLSPARAILGTVDVAARLGLEAAGVSVPIVRLPAEIESGADEPTLVLIGDHPLLQEDSIPPVMLGDGEGVIRVIPGAFGAKAALAVDGLGAGLDRAIEQLAVSFPHLGARGKDRATVDSVEMDLWKFLTARSPAGQAATALYKLDQIVESLEADEIRSAKVLVSLEKPAPGFESVVRAHAEELGISGADLEVVLDDRDVQSAGVIFENSFAVSSEVDEFWRLFRERALSEVRGREDVRVEVRLSEPPAIRRAIADEIRKEIGGSAQVHVISAYKQGYSWLYDVVRPKLTGRDIETVKIRVARYRPPEEWSQQAMHTPLRWLQEAFPIDEMLGRDLSLDLSVIQFEMASDDDPPYEVVATAPDGSVVLRESFSPRLVVRPYIDRFRDYEMVGVTTGWVEVRAGDEIVLSQRIATDAERFWDHYQSETLPAMYDYVMDRHDGNPRGDGKDAPYFGELTVDLTLSEPHYLLDLDKELISPIDALHEDIYFTTLMFFRILGRNARGEELTYAGRILPRVRPKSDGAAGTAHIRFTGFATDRPAVVVDYVRRDGSEGRARRNLPKVAVDRPSALTAKVSAGVTGLTGLELRVKVDTESDERDELQILARSEDVDERIFSAEQAVAMVRHLNELTERGLYRSELSYAELGSIHVRAGWEHEVQWESEPVATLRHGDPGPSPDITRFPAPSPGAEIVQWETPIPPPEAYGILARMAEHEGATVYKVGESYLGHDVWAMDLMPPTEASHLSQGKATTMKPTVVYSARQHANEVSSTSHVLKLAELLLTDPEERKKLDKVNVVIHPMTNPDGAQLAYDLYRETPELILHAGYYASLGMDVTADGDDPMPIYPESTVRRRLWETWRPDIFLNPHGYPSHQLVQLFSEYTGLVRRGRITERNWSMNKGWFMPGFGYTDDPRFPRHKDAAMSIRDYITEAINGSPEVYAMNQRNYDRYRRYGAAFDEDEVYKMPMTNEVMIHTALKGSRAPSPGSRGGYDPKITVWSGTTEAPDETAHGDWMKLVATAGLSWDRAILQYLVDGEHRVERKSTEFWGGVSMSLDRPRPPKKDDEEQTDNEPESRDP